MPALAIIVRKGHPVATEYYKRGTLLASEHVRMQVGAQPPTAWQNIKAHRVSLLVKNGLLFVLIAGGLWAMSHVPDTPPPPGMPGFMRYLATYSGVCFTIMGLFVAGLDLWATASTYAWPLERVVSRNVAEVAKLCPESRHAIHKQLSLELESKGAFFC